MILHYRQFCHVGNQKASMSMAQAGFDISTVLQEFTQRAPAGYALGLHITFTTPAYFFQSYPRAWLDHYSNAGLLINDPTVSWCFENTGACRWSDLSDPAGVLTAAARYGMRYGIVYATSAHGSHSMSGFARGDRDFTDEEIAVLARKFDALHDATRDQAALPAQTVAQLKKMSIIVTHPGG